MMIMMIMECMVCMRINGWINIRAFFLGFSNCSSYSQDGVQRDHEEEQEAMYAWYMPSGASFAE